MHAHRGSTAVLRSYVHVMASAKCAREHAQDRGARAHSSAAACRTLSLNDMLLTRHPSVVESWGRSYIQYIQVFRFFGSFLEGSLCVNSFDYSHLGSHVSTTKSHDYKI